ncbi:unnamed protein product [Schistosoma margrebowiei]|uniref:Reverse transcriptase domain-containing protein n=1 Tax=Schistosoma margrebowiei TaxID=48269 RepID=A0A183N5I3_9TREM|nr:unnamed protein product [Schistosoma margrebowiei]
MQCDECKGWYHEVCTNLTPAAFKRYSKKGCVWLCQHCCSDANSLLTEAISLVDAAKKCFSKHSRNASNSTRYVDTQINAKETKVSPVIDDSRSSKKEKQSPKRPALNKSSRKVGSSAPSLPDGIQQETPRSRNRKARSVSNGKHNTTSRVVDNPRNPTLGLTQLLSLLPAPLTNGQQYTAFGGKCSESLLSHEGVSQGAILSPPLFSFLLHDLTSYTESTFVKYANDITVCMSISSSLHPIEMNELLSRIDCWTVGNSFILNPSKCQAGNLSMRRERHLYTVLRSHNACAIGDSLKNTVSKVNYLGFTFSYDLSLSAHFLLLSK